MTEIQDNQSISSLALSKSISVVIPNYNGRKLLEDNLPSVYQAIQKAAVDYEIIVVDDASQDESVKFLEHTYPDILLLKNEVNQGFSPTINKGIMQAQKDLVFALNSDVQLTPNYFLEQFKYFTKEDTFGVMGRIVDFHTNKTVGTAKYPEQKLSQKIQSTIDFYIEPNPKDFWIPSLFLSGANALIDRKKIQELEGFDEIYAPFYGEDVDLSLRAWRLGWKSYYEHSSICKHATSSTIKSHHKKRKIHLISTRNKFIMHSLHLDGFPKVIWNLKVLLDFCISFIAFKFNFYKAFWMFLNLQKELKISKRKFRFLMRKYEYKQSLFKIMKQLRKDIDEHSVIRLNELD